MPILFVCACMLLFGGCQIKGNQLPAQHVTAAQGNAPSRQAGTDDLAAAKRAMAGYFLAIGLNQFDEARKYVVSGGGFSKGIDKFEKEYRDDPSAHPPDRSSDTIESTASMMMGKLEGDKAYLQWTSNPYTVYVVVKQNGSWLVLDAQEHLNNK
jgi:hypothetical protein